MFRVFECTHLKILGCGTEQECAVLVYWQWHSLNLISMCKSLEWPLQVCMLCSAICTIHCFSTVVIFWLSYYKFSFKIMFFLSFVFLCSIFILSSCEHWNSHQEVKPYYNHCWTPSIYLNAVQCRSDTKVKKKKKKDVDLVLRKLTM